MSILVAVRDRLLDVSPILPLRGQDVLALRRRGFGARQLAQGEPADWLVAVLYVLEQLDPTITLPAGAFTFDFGKIRAGFDQIVKGAEGIKTQFVEVGVAVVDAGKVALNFLDSLLTKTADVTQKMIDGWVAYAEAVIAETELTPAGAHRARGQGRQREPSLARSRDRWMGCLCGCGHRGDD